jgi:hypothetical protein
MYENREQYEAIVKDKTLILETFFGYPIRHGGADACMRCGAQGHYDLDGLGFSPKGGNAIYYSTVFLEWRCRLCDHRRIA